MAQPLTISCRDFADFWVSEKSVDKVLKVITELFDLGSLSSPIKDELKKNVSKHCAKMKKKWAKLGRRVEGLHVDPWYCGNDKLDLIGPVIRAKGAGRPVKPYEESGFKSRTIKSIKSTKNVSELDILHRSSIILKNHGMLEVSNLVLKLAAKIANKDNSPECNIITPDQALATISDTKLSTRSYIKLRKVFTKNSLKVLPSYPAIKRARTAIICRPIVTDDSASIPLQSLLNITARQILRTIDDLNPDTALQATLISKWGLDGSGGQSLYKQNLSSGMASDGSIFSCQLVPLRLQLNDENNTIIWENPAPNSTWLCRPIFIKYIKDTSKVTRAMTSEVELEIFRLIPTTVNSIRIKHRLFQTMLDGKSLNYLTHSSSQACPLCRKRGEDLNKFDPKVNPLPTAMKEYGLSTLHGWLRGLDFFLQIAYANSNKTKKQIQDEFERELQLLVDMPLSGFGTTNDGNTARKFFGEHKTTSRITGIPEELINRFHVIMSTLSGSHFIDPVKLENYTFETASLIRICYPTKNFTPTIHKILFHSPAIVSHFNQFNLPVGALSEEALESRNKDVRNFRELYTRKISRVDNLTDLIKHLMVTSDPYLNKFRIRPKVNSSKSYSNEMLDLILQDPDIPIDIDQFE